MYQANMYQANMYQARGHRYTALFTDADCRIALCPMIRVQFYNGK